MKQLFKNKSVRSGAIAVLYITVYCVFYSGKHSFFLNLLDSVFSIGLIYLVIGMAFYIHNIGLFKTFRYWGYRIKASRLMGKNASYDAKPMDLVAYTQHIMALPKKSTAHYLLWGLALIALSSVLLLLRIDFI